MGTESWSTRLRHDSDATWQEWRDELIARLVSAGAVADETNITPGAGARPGTNTEGGYAVFHLGDSLHGTAPVYIRFGLGTAGGATTPRIQATVGTSTNGSGVLGGTALTTIRTVHGAGVAQTTDTARQSYLCVTDGFLGFNWKTGSGTSEASFFAMRSVDQDDGSIGAVAALVVWGAANPGGMTATQALRFAATAAAFTAQTGPVNTAICISPQTPISTAVGADNQAMVAWTITPRVERLVGVMGVLNAEIAAGNTFSNTPVGTTARTYIALTTFAGPAGPITASDPSGLKFAMLWE